MLFLLGAGFNIDAAGIAKDLGILEHDPVCNYPLVSDTLKICFGAGNIPPGKSVEVLFAEAIAANSDEPMDRLSNFLMKADGYIARRLAHSEKPNCYRGFFEAFQDCQFLTFNYDSLVETFLFQMGRWFPHDGFGVNADVQRPWDFKGPPGTAISTLTVLHLHGSLCVYATEFEITADRQLVQRERPYFTFDPSEMSGKFTSYERKVGWGYRHPHERVIAPVPSKAEGLTEVFIKEVYAKAEGLVCSSGNLVAIGYSFNEHDRESWVRILSALSASSHPKLLLVSPESESVAERLRPAFPRIEIGSAKQTLKKWIDGAFRGSAGMVPEALAKSRITR